MVLRNRVEPPLRTAETLSQHQPGRAIAHISRSTCSTPIAFVELGEAIVDNHAATPRLSCTGAKNQGLFGQDLMWLDRSFQGDI